MTIERHAPAFGSRHALLGVPSSAGARMAGQEMAPEALRRAGLVERLRSTGHDLIDLGDLDRVTFEPDADSPRLQNLGPTRAVVESVARALEPTVAGGARPLVIGGDCTVTLGVLAALGRRVDRLGLVYFDGDVDLNTPETTRTGILDGMALAHMLGRGAPELSGVGTRHPLVAEEAVLLFGYSVEAGGIDPVEIDLLRTSRMARYPLEAVADRAVAAAEEALRDLESRVDGLVVHFDVDVIDFDELPAVDVPHRPGLSWEKAREVLAVFARSEKMVALVVTELNPARDRDGRLARRLTETLVSALPAGSALEARFESARSSE